MNISLQKQIDLIKKAIMHSVTFDSREDAEEFTRDVIIEYLNLLQEDSKPLTVNELLKTMNENGKR